MHVDFLLLFIISYLNIEFPQNNIYILAYPKLNEITTKQKFKIIGLFLVYTVLICNMQCRH